MIRRVNFALIGKMGAGKDTVANLLVTDHGYRHFKMSKPIVDACETLFGKVDRETGQAVGDLIQKLDPYGLTARLDEQITEAIGESKIYGPIVVEAPRYPSDYEGVARLDYGFQFRFIEVYADEATRVDRLQKNGRLETIDQLYVPGEVALDDRDKYPRDYVIDNGPGVTLEGIRIQIEEIIRKEATRV